MSFKINNNYLYQPPKAVNKNETLLPNKSSEVPKDTLQPADLSTQEAVISQPVRKEESPSCLYRFPENFHISTQNNTFDLSKIEIDLSEICQGGIGYNASASQLMADGMQSLGHGERIYNLPFCLEGKLYKDFKLLQIISVDNAKVSLTSFKETISQAIKTGFLYFNLPIDLNNHGSLASVIISKNKGVLRYYDSMSPKDLEYKDRYSKELTDYIKSIFSEIIEIEEEPAVLHLLYQGGESSNGCGYYSIYTAWLLKDNPEFRNLKISNCSQILFNETHDKQIRTELAVRSLLTFGVEKGENQPEEIAMFGKRTRIFHQLGATPLKGLMKSIKIKTNNLMFQFPDNFRVDVKGHTYDISNLALDLSQIFKGGIGYGANSSQLMATGMEALGSNQTVCNLPFCIEEVLDFPEQYRKLELISTHNKVVDFSSIKEKAAKALLSGATHLNIPLNLDGHASLACFVISNGKASLRFYESLSSEEINYDDRYTPVLIKFIKSLLPESVSLKEPYEVMHLLRQGDKGSGYYSIYTALLLKDHEEIRNLNAAGSSPLLFDETHDKQIRAELVIRTLLAYGVENAEAQINDLFLYRKVEHIFQRLGGDLKEVCAFFH